MVQYLQKRWQEHRDQPIWETIREPKYKLHHIDGSGEHHDKQCELPYSLDDLTKKFGRSVGSISRSLNRLERRGKVKDVAGGWQRKEK